MKTLKQTILKVLFLSFVYLQQNNAEIISATWLQNNQTGQNIFLYGDRHIVEPENEAQIEKIVKKLLPSTKDFSIFIENYNSGIQREEDKFQILHNLTKEKDNFTQIEFIENRRIIENELYVTNTIINEAKKYILFTYNKKKHEEIETENDLTLYNETENQAPLLFFNEMKRMHNIGNNTQNFLFSDLIGVKNVFIVNDIFYTEFLHPFTGGRILAHQEIQYLKNELNKNKNEIKQIILELLNILSQTTIKNVPTIMEKLDNDLYKPIFEEYDHLISENDEDYNDGKYSYIHSQLHAIKNQLYHLQINPTVPSFNVVSTKTKGIINNLEKKIRKKKNSEIYDHLYTIVQKEKNDFFYSMKELEKSNEILQEDLMEESISFILREQFETLEKSKLNCLEKDDRERKQRAIMIISKIENLANKIHYIMLTLFDINTIIKILDTKKQNIIIFAGAYHTNNISKILTTYTNNFKKIATQGKTIFEDESFFEWNININSILYESWKERTVNLDVFDWPTFDTTQYFNPAYFDTEKSNKRKRENNTMTKRRRLE